MDDVRNAMAAHGFQLQQTLSFRITRLDAVVF